MKLSRTITFLKAALLAAITAPIFIPPACGQQEVDPTWYSPWPDALKPTAKLTPPKIAEHKDGKATRKDHASATPAEKRPQKPVHTAEVLPPVTK